MLHWDIYEISSTKYSLNGVMLRGRIRKFALDNQKDVLVENTSDKENGVRFAVLSDTDTKEIQNYLKSIVSDLKIACILQRVKNPVLSKLKINQEERYTV